MSALLGAGRGARRRAATGAALAISVAVAACRSGPGASTADSDEPPSLDYPEPACHLEKPRWDREWGKQRRQIAALYAGLEQLEDQVSDGCSLEDRECRARWTAIGDAYAAVRRPIDELASRCGVPTDPPGMLGYRYAHRRYLTRLANRLLQEANETLQDANPDRRPLLSDFGKAANLGGCCFDDCEAAYPLMDSWFRFRLSVAQLGRDQTRVINGLATKLRDLPLHRVRLIGHFVEQETEESAALGLARARAVESALLARGVDRNQLTVAAEAVPIEARPGFDEASIVQGVLARPNGKRPCPPLPGAGHPTD